VNPGALVADGSLLVAIPLAMLAGLISFLSPCVLPLVPGYLGFITGAVTPRPAVVVGGSANDERADATARRATALTEQPTPSRGRLLLGVVLFIAGFTVVFVSIAMLGGTLGRFLLEYADLITRILGVVIIVMGLVFMGAFGLAQRIARPQVRGNLGLVGAPLLGIALGIGWAPCIGPTLGAIIAVSWNLGDPARAGVLGLAYSLGLGIPFLLLAAGFGWASKSVAFLRRHIRLVNIIGGTLLVLLGLLMVSGVWGALMSYLQGVFLNVPLPL
jgi:cytochrome c-type biogenesis protein